MLTKCVRITREEIAAYIDLDAEIAQLVVLQESFRNLRIQGIDSQSLMTNFSDNISEVEKV